MRPDVITVSAAISACEKSAESLGCNWIQDWRGTELLASARVLRLDASRWQQAFELFGGLQRLSLRPNVVAAGAVISALEKGRESLVNG